MATLVIAVSTSVVLAAASVALSRFSGRHALLLLALLLLSFIALMTLKDFGTPWFPITHPLGGLWRLIYHGESVRLTIPVPRSYAWASLITWLVILCLGAWHSAHVQR
ncbi:hypothetical protein M3G03_00575 [Aestuariimicrobium sp. p3-SID1156]|uniref:hypothetical protein n=1 Tax=Aestuariimicrobium sp. p3-SID1156 TaxID=2916038 RepID=UPI00223B117F|nr:hypothetical protein [Aestuariimicrobium sp. p3-SID1156]MCT1458050.1 hypothetical protein [Aestuariimicrobium sp. p3-SID1156]